jgi:methylenetetrahydrofolate reductase (NADPH)
VLRGDIPSGVRDVYDFNYANKLVEFIKNNHNNYFHLSVAAYPEIHPQAKDAKDDIYNFVNKVKAGANNAITQYFYNPDAYFRFCDEVAKLGVTIPIVPGIMPITNYKQLTRFSNNCGADIPKWILERLKLYENNLQDLTLFGIEVVSKLCQTLKSNGVDNFHFYSMNKSWPAIEIVNNINDN